MIRPGEEKGTFAVPPAKKGVEGVKQERWFFETRTWNLVPGLAARIPAGDNAGMPRTARADAGGFCYHVMNLGNGQAEVFHKDGDYAAFAKLLREGCARLPMRLLSYCLMPNHFHLAVWPRKDGDLGVWMQWLLTTHVRRYHRHYHSSGHVWQGRYKAFPIQEDQHLLTVLRYIKRNALRAGLVGRAEDWPWSSLRWWSAPGSLPFLDPGPVPRGDDWP